MAKWRYGVILDAGSSGTRVHIYRWLKTDKARAAASDNELHRLPALETKKKWTKKIHPGLSTFAHDPSQVGPDHLAPLFQHALDTIPPSDVAETPLFLLATAGLRILPEPQQRALLDHVCAFAQQTTAFQLPDCDLHINVITGETEGLYGWVAANYLLGGFDRPRDHDHGKGHHTYGFLDMGGASAQMAFAPNSTEAETHANDLHLLRLRTLNGDELEHRVFVTTWLGFGANQARQRYVDALVESSPDAPELPDPCLPAGLKVAPDGTPVADPVPGQYLLGTGRFSECMRRTFPLLDKDAPCPDVPCLLHGQHAPAIDFDVNHFIGVSEYWHTTHDVFDMSHKEGAYDFRRYQDRVRAFCSQSWDDIRAGVDKKKWGDKVDEQKARGVCFKASWLMNVLHDGIGVPRVGLEHGLVGINRTTAAAGQQKTYLDPFQAVNRVHGVEVSWTLGKMVLYASSEVPAPALTALPVGFGSNEPGIPSDFQYAGGEYKPHRGDDWHDALYASPRRAPGLVFAAVVVVVLLFALCGRDRRASLRWRAGHLLDRRGPGAAKRQRGLAGSLFKRQPAGGYERVPDAPAADAALELDDVVASDAEPWDNASEAQRIGRASGWATPRVAIAGGALREPATPAFPDGSSSTITSTNVFLHGTGLGLVLAPTSSAHDPFHANAMDRGGLSARTDSRDRLGSAGRRSRQDSPARLRSPLLFPPVKESVD